MLWSKKFLKNGRTSAPTPGHLADFEKLPFPDGWFGLAFSDELPAGEVLTRPFMGEDVVLYRLASGGLRAVRPYCPHLGAHLGAGGRVSGDELVCPFHHFAFGPDGKCVRTGYGFEPPKASLGHRLVREVNGVIWVWHHHAGDSPDWEIPELEPVGGHPPTHATMDLAGHPQEVIENAVDVGHVAVLHSVTDYEVVQQPEFDGRTFTMVTRAWHRIPFVGRREVVYRFRAFGLGAIIVDAQLPVIGLDLRITTLATASAVGKVNIHYGVSMSQPEPPERLDGALTQAACAAIGRTLARGVLLWLGPETSADCDIWHYKKYEPAPRIARGDGRIGAYRRWAAQFFPSE